ncbi:Heat shock cognate 70 kDa protein [Taenia solium]|eukprot:TsM_000381900 transcript=TsM_000381900 gene=TsM_000381900
MLAIVYQTLSDAKLDKADVHEVLLVGGSTRILKVQHLLQDFFSDEAAASSAALLTSSMIDKQSLEMLEAAPLSAKLVTSGERLVTNENNLVGEVIVLGIPPSPRRFSQTEITFFIDGNGIIDVSAVDVLSGQQMNVYARNTSSLSEGQIKQMMNEAEELKLENEKQRSKVATRNELESYIFTIQSKLVDDEIRQKTSKEQRNRALKVCETALKCIDLKRPQRMTTSLCA